MLDRDKVAILDIDGTLYPGSLGIDVLKQLALESLGHREHIDAVFEILNLYSRGARNYEEMTRAAYASYAMAIKGLPHATLACLCERVWTDAQHRLFSFVRPLAGILKDHDFRILIISGSPQEVVDNLKNHIGAHSAWGSDFEVRDGCFTGKLGKCPGMIGEKLAIFREYMANTPTINLTASIAIGDSVTDRDLFEVVGLPFVFEPNDELATSLREDKSTWPVVNKSNILDAIKNSLVNGPQDHH